MSRDGPPVSHLGIGSQNGTSLTPYFLFSEQIIVPRLICTKLSDDKFMHAGKVRLLLLVLFTISVAKAQSPDKHSGGTAAGSLQVTATVAPSVWLVIDPDSKDPDGKQQTVVANAPDAKETFFHAAAPQKHKTTSGKTLTTDSLKQASTGIQRRLPPDSQGDAAIQFSVPSPKQFEVKHEIIVMNVSKDGKTERQPVEVTTVVPR